MKGFHQQKYTCIIEVCITFSDGLTFTDQIKGLNTGHALYLAQNNWENAKIDLIRVI